MTAVVGAAPGDQVDVDQARVLIAHDYLTQRGGGERVALSLLGAFPGATLITSVYDPDGTYPEFAQFDVRTMWLDRFPAFRADPRRAFPVLARAFSTVQAPEADVVICSTSGWAHGLRTTAPKIAYCHTPARWLYETDDYLTSVPRPLRLPAQAALPMLRRWDQRAAGSVSRYLANSTVVRARIERAYGRPADLLHPPVTLDASGPQDPVPGLEDGFLLSVSRRRGYKNVETVCEVVEQLPDERLVVVGGLPPRPGGGTWSSRVRGVSDVSDAQLRWLYSHAAALVALSHEDFGLTPVEAYTFGTPAVLLRAGGYLDSGLADRTCVYVDGEGVEPLRDALLRFRGLSFDETLLRRHGAAFGEAQFHAAVREAARQVLTRSSRDVPQPRLGTRGTERF